MNAQFKFRDSINNALCKIRAGIMRKFGNDIHLMFEHLRSWERAHPGRMADPRRIGKSGVGRGSTRRPRPKSAAILRDPIVEEVRAARAKLTRRCRGDVLAMCRSVIEDGDAQASKGTRARQKEVSKATSLETKQKKGRISPRVKVQNGRTRSITNGRG